MYTYTYFTLYMLRFYILSANAASEMIGSLMNMFSWGSSSSTPQQATTSPTTATNTNAATNSNKPPKVSLSLSIYLFNSQHQSPTTTDYCDDAIHIMFVCHI
jgi:hypothetical protein